MRLRLLALACLALSLSACGGGGSTSVPNTPNASSALIEITNVDGSVAAGVTVILSTALAGTLPEGVITQAITNASGQVTFNSLPSGGQLCVSASIAAGGGNAAQFAGECLQPFPANLTLQF